MSTTNSKVPPPVRNKSDDDRSSQAPAAAVKSKETKQPKKKQYLQVSREQLEQIFKKIFKKKKKPSPAPAPKNKVSDQAKSHQNEQISIINQKKIIERYSSEKWVDPPVEKSSK